MVCTNCLAKFKTESLPFRQTKTVSQTGYRFCFCWDSKDSNGSVVNDCRWQSEPTLTEAAAETESLPFRPKIPPVVCVIDKYRRL